MILMMILACSTVPSAIAKIWPSTYSLLVSARRSSRRYSTGMKRRRTRLTSNTTSGYLADNGKSTSLTIARQASPWRISMRFCQSPWSTRDCHCNQKLSAN